MFRLSSAYHFIRIRVPVQFKIRSALAWCQDERNSTIQEYSSSLFPSLFLPRLYPPHVILSSSHGFCFYLCPSPKSPHHFPPHTPACPRPRQNRALSSVSKPCARVPVWSLAATVDMLVCWAVSAGSPAWGGQDRAGPLEGPSRVRWLLACRRIAGSGRRVGGC